MKDATCTNCGGSGKEQYESSRIGYDSIYSYRTCSSCGGKGSWFVEEKKQVKETL